MNGNSQDTEHTSDSSLLSLRGRKTEHMIVSEQGGQGGVGMEEFCESFTVILYLYITSIIKNTKIDCPRERNYLHFVRSNCFRNDAGKNMFAKV